LVFIGINIYQNWFEAYLDEWITGDL